MPTVCYLSDDMQKVYTVANRAHTTALQLI